MYDVLINNVHRNFNSDELTIQPDSIQSFLNSAFDRNKSEVFNATE